jgi:hypothetical protein
MKSMFRLIVLVVLLAGWSIAALALHVVRTPTKIVIVPKQSLGYHDTYVDTRNWSLDDVSNHPMVVNDLIAHDKADVLQNVAPTDSGDALVADLKAAVAKGPVVKDVGATSQPSVIHEVKEAVKSHVSV